MAVQGPGGTGRAIVSGTLPAGQYYVPAAVDTLDIASWRDPSSFWIASASWR